MISRIKQVRSKGDSVGGVIECRVRGVPVGLGEPVFDRLEADLAKAMLSLPATKGFEIGSGFAGTRLKGSQHNDVFVNKRGRIGTQTTGPAACRRHQQRRGDCLPRRLQAHRHDSPVAAHRGSARREHRAQGPRPPRSCVVPRAS